MVGLPDRFQLPDGGDDANAEVASAPELSLFATEDTMNPTRIIQATALAALIPLLAPSARAATECKAEVRATAKSDQVSDRAITKVWAVEIDTQESCAIVYVDAVVTERLFDGEVITSTRRGSRKVANHTSTHKVNYQIALDSTLMSSKFTVARCVVCGTE